MWTPHVAESVRPPPLPPLEPSSGGEAAPHLAWLQSLRPGEQVVSTFRLQAGRAQLWTARQAPPERGAPSALAADRWTVCRAGGQAAQVGARQRWHWSALPLPGGRAELAGLLRLSRLYRHPWEITLRIRWTSMDPAERQLLMDMGDDLRAMAGWSGWTAAQRRALAEVSRRHAWTTRHLTHAPLVLDVTVDSSRCLPDHFGAEVSTALTGSPGALLVRRSALPTAREAWPPPESEKLALWSLQRRYTLSEVGRIVPPLEAGRPGRSPR